MESFPHCVTSCHELLLPSNSYSSDASTIHVKYIFMSAQSVIIEVSNGTEQKENGPNLAAMAVSGFQSESGQASSTCVYEPSQHPSAMMAGDMAVSIAKVISHRFRLFVTLNFCIEGLPVVLQFISPETDSALHHKKGREVLLSTAITKVLVSDLQQMPLGD